MRDSKEFRAMAKGISPITLMAQNNAIAPGATGNELYVLERPVTA
jgi:hypothetical protein